MQTCLHDEVGNFVNTLYGLCRATKHCYGKTIQLRPGNGHFYWAIGKLGKKAGEIAGHTQRNGYTTITEFGKSQLAHRVA